MIYLGDKKLASVNIVPVLPEMYRKLCAGPDTGELRIPDEIKKLRNNILQGGQWTNIDLNNVEEFGERALYGCNQITDLKLSSKITKIGSQAFSGMSKWAYRDYSQVKLTANMQGAQRDTYTGVIGFKFGDNTYVPSLFAHYCNTLDTNYIDLSKIVEFGGGAFSGHPDYPNDLFTHLNLSSARIIGQSAFARRQAMTEIIFNPNETYTIGIGAFGFDSQNQFNRFGSKLEHLYMDKVEKIDGYAFRFQQALKTVYIGADCTSINTRTFDGCIQDDLVITINQPQDSIKGAPWGATNATIIWNG
jgi:hypothetical protein